jgi:ABC-2 type transport system permease protein
VFFSDPMAAIVEKELRTFARIPRFRLVYAMSCFLGIVLFLPAATHADRHSFMTENALPMASLYGLLMLGQVSYWNSLGFDGSAAQGYFSWPIRFREVLLAKNISVLCLLVPQILVLWLLGRALHFTGTFEKLIEAVMVMFISSAYWFGMGNITSVRIPRALNAEKMNQMATKMQFVTIWSAPFLLMPIVLAYWSRWFFGSELVFVAVMLVAAVIGGIVYWVGLDSAVNAATARRESIILELSRSDGPLSIA